MHGHTVHINEKVSECSVDATKPRKLSSRNFFTNQPHQDTKIEPSEVVISLEGKAVLILIPSFMKSQKENSPNKKLW